MSRFSEKELLSLRALLYICCRLSDRDLSSTYKYFDDSIIIEDAWCNVFSMLRNRDKK